MTDDAQHGVVSPETARMQAQIDQLATDMGNFMRTTLDELAMLGTRQNVLGESLKSVKSRLFEIENNGVSE